MTIRELEEIKAILIELTDALGYNHTNRIHAQAFKKAERDLLSLCERIDNAERC